MEFSCTFADTLAYFVLGMAVGIGLMFIVWFLAIGRGEFK